MTTRRLFLRQVAAGLLTPLPMFFQRALAAGDKPLRPGLFRLNGTVTVNGQVAAAGMLIRSGDTVATGAGSEAIYVVGQDAFLQRDNSVVSFVGDSAVSALRIVTGKLLSVFGKGHKKIHSTTATIGIRGTGCYIEAEAARTYICLCYGEADFVPTIAPDQAVRLATTHHEQPLWISGENRQQPIAKAPMINHTDAELTLLENLVGRFPPFGQDGSRY